MRRVWVAVILLALAAPARGADSVLCLSTSDGSRLLRAVEKDLPDCRKELEAYKAMDNGAAASLQECREQVDLQAGRIDELTRERDTCVSLLDNTAEAAEAAVDTARGSWWDRMKAAGGWLAGGIVIGLAVALLAL